MSELDKLKYLDASLIYMEKISDFLWKIPKEGPMRVPALVIASDKLLEKMKQDKTLVQIANVTTLPGIQKHAIVMPDGHEGYGFPIGGVAAFDAEEGGVSPGGVGFDINCGVRLLRTNLRYEDLKGKLNNLVEILFKNIPSGLGSKGKVRVTHSQLDEVLEEGVNWALRNGYGWDEDIERIEEYGKYEGADSTKVSDRAKKRGMPQLGSLGSGNHFLEVQKVDKIYDEETAKKFGIEEEGQVTVMIHTGSRGLGHQVCGDYIKIIMEKHKDLIKKLPDPQLVFAPSSSKEFEDYLKAMKASANFAWTNRQMITHWVRESFEKVFNESAESLGLNLVYDVAHNLAKFEEHEINGVNKKLYVHRKGATRAFGPGHKELPKIYQSTGQPVIIPGSMGTASYLLVGSKKAEDLTFGSTAHGAGRVMSRHAALRTYTMQAIEKELSRRGIILKSASRRGAIEEAPGAYKDIDEVARVSHEIGIGRKVARLVPMGVIKG